MTAPILVDRYRTVRVLDEAPTEAGSSEVYFKLNADAFIGGLVVRSVSGTVTVKVYAVADTGEEIQVAEWPVRATASTVPVVERASVTFAQRHRVSVVYTGACDYTLRLKATEGESLSTFDAPTPVQIAGASITATGDVKVTNAHPEIQAYAERYADPRYWTQFTASGGAVTGSESLLTCTTGTTVGAYAVCRTRRFQTYHPGQGATFRYTAMFTAGVANSTQVAGPYHAEDGFAFGYNGTSFGILHRYGRRLDIRALTVTVGAAGAETLTITLNGTAHAVAVTAGSTSATARQIADWSGTYADVAGYDVYALGSVVYFMRRTHGVASGTYSLTSTGAATGTWAQIQAGANGTESWTPAASWSEDPMDGTGPSRMVLDPTKLNVYEIRLAWLGALPPSFWVADQVTGQMRMVHRIPWANLYTVPHVRDPRFPISYAAASLGSTTSLSVSGASVYSESTGADRDLGARWSDVDTIAAAGVTEVPILAVSAAFVDTGQSKPNRRRVQVNEVRAANVGATRDLIVSVYRGTAKANLTGYVFSVLTASSSLSHVWIDKTATAFVSTGASLLATTVLSPDTSDIMSLDSYPVHQGEVLIVTVKTVSGTTETVVSINGVEDL